MMYEAILMSAETGVSAATMSGLLGEISTILTSATDWLGAIVSTVTSNPLLLLGVVLPFVGFGVGLFKRLLNV